MSDEFGRDDVMAAIHETAAGLHVGGIVDKRTMREFDALTSARVPDLSPEEIREREHVSSSRGRRS